MWVFKIFIFISFSILINAWEDSSGLILTINDGTILGRYMTSETGKPLKAFLGIPYGKAPIGDLRFRAPQKIEPWEGVKRTQADGNSCVQSFGPNPGPPIGDEDCLFLNVFVPLNVTTKMPVLVWIHGGRWAFGSGASSSNGPDYLLESEIILVSINYRVGPLGFLSTESGDAQGNFALKDQQLALRWIQDNIEHFGGDKNSVTIFGGEIEIVKEQSFKF